MLNIIAGSDYRVSSRANMNFMDSGRALPPGRLFKANQTTRFNDRIQWGIAYGKIIEEPVGTAAARAARLLANRLAARTYLLHDSSKFADDYRLQQERAAFAFQDANGADFAVTLNAILDEATAITGTVAIACTLQTVKNGVDHGAPFVVAAPGAYNHAISPAAQTGDTYGVYAVVVGTPNVRLTDTVSFHIALEAAPAISGTLTASGSAVVTGTSSAPAATPVTLYKAGSTVIGTGVTVGGGGWTIAGVVLVGTDSVTAKTGSGASLSPPSAAKIVHFAAPVITPVPADTDTIVAGTSTDLVGGHTINVYSDNPAPDTLIGTTTTTAVTGAWSATTTAVATGDSLYATLGAGANLSANSAAVVVVP